MRKLKNDYKIESYYSYVTPEIEKFKIVYAGKTLSVHPTYESAAREVVKLVFDPWYHDRGYTRVDRAKSD